ncbi:MAG: hemolysin family protein [Actinomycetota bacterium]
MAVLLLILAHGLFVAGEFSIVTVDRGRIEQLAEDGQRGAASTLQAVRTLSFQLSGAQLGITLTSLVVGFLVEPTIGEALSPLIERAGLPPASAHGAAIAVALGCVTGAEMVVGELVPKNLAIAEPLRVAFMTATPLRLFNRSLRVVILFLNNAANWTVSRLGIEPQEELTLVRSLEELQMLVHSSRAHGTLLEEGFSLLARSFSFGGKTAADALVPRTSVVALEQHESLTSVAEVALSSGHSRFPVYGDDLDDVLGVAHVKDVLRVPLERRAHMVVAETMRTPLIVPESRDLESLLVEMRRQRQHLAIVFDEYGGTAGIITLEDVLEEIVGDIEDEYDSSATPQATGPPGGVHVLSGMLHPDEVAEKTGFEMPEGDYETLAGFLLALLERIPEQGDHACHDGWELKVTEMDKRRIARVLLVAPPDPEDQGDLSP